MQETIDRARELAANLDPEAVAVTALIALLAGASVWAAKVSAKFSWKTLAKAFAKATLTCTRGPEEGLSLNLIDGTYTVGRARETYRPALRSGPDHRQHSWLVSGPAEPNSERPCPSEWGLGRAAARRRGAPAAG